MFLAGFTSGQEEEAMNASVSDTSPAVERVLLEGYRRMSAREKLQRVVALNRALQQLARARILAQYGEHVTERELRHRLGALRLDRVSMVRAFDWDPDAQGY
jgi:hypothetical protein